MRELFFAIKTDLCPRCLNPLRRKLEFDVKYEVSSATFTCDLCKFETGFDTPGISSVDEGFVLRGSV